MNREWHCTYPSGYSAVVRNCAGTVHTLDIRTPLGDSLLGIAVLMFSIQEAMQKADSIIGWRSRPDQWALVSDEPRPAG